MKHFDKFYEIGYNRYYTLKADNDLYLATESFINLGQKKLFRKQDYITQGFKLLKLTTPIFILFRALEDMPKIKGKKCETEDMIKYKHINNKSLKKEIEKNYTEAFEEQKAELNSWLDTMETELKDRISDDKGSYDVKEFEEKFKVYQERYENSVKVLKDHNPLNNILDLKNPDNNANTVIKAMMEEGLEHLCTERFTTFASNVFLYEQDSFGTLTIYRIIVVKNVVKTIDTFIYDKKLVEELLKTIYEKEL